MHDSEDSHYLVLETNRIYEDRLQLSLKQDRYSSIIQEAKSDTKKSKTLICSDSDEKFSLDHCPRWPDTTNPERFLQKLLLTRGYTSEPYPHDASLNSSPNPKNLADYTLDVLSAVRNSDVVSLNKLRCEGRSLSACNKFGESVIHLACRRSDYETVEFILSHVGGELWIKDDYGRNPLHDACWRTYPDFRIASLIMNRNPDLIRMQDVRGSTPLDYVRKDHYYLWYEFLYRNKEKYWPILEAKGC